jgi:chromosome segregation ATPase
MNKQEIQEEPRLSLDESGQNKKCYICAKSFNFRKKHICRFCQNAVCSEHCQKSRPLENLESQPICDLCFQEEIRTELRAESQSHIKNLDEEFKDMQNTNSRLEREHFEKTAHINRLEFEIETASSTYNTEVEGLNTELAALKSQNSTLQSSYQKTKAKLAEIKENEEKASENLSKVQEELEVLRRQSEILKETKEGLNVQLDKINGKLKGCLNIEHVDKLLCQMCSSRLKDAAGRRIDAPSILENPSICMSVDEERESIIQSVRDMKDELTKQSSRPGEGGGCWII